MTPPKRLRVLILTKVFPNALQPLAAAFNRQQFASLARLADLQLLVPVQWFPGATALGDRTEAGRLADLPDYEWMDGLFVNHPRVFHLPRLDYPIAAGLYVASLWRQIRQFRGRIDVIMGSFVYPDGVAATWMGRMLGVPSVIYALGSDINILPSIPGVSTLLRWTLPKTNRVVAVSQDLADKVVALGGPRERVVVVPNGVNRALFFPQDRQQARQELAAFGSDTATSAREKWILFVGRLEPAKGLAELLTAFEDLAQRDATLKLVLVGNGSFRARCEEAAARLPGRILVAGPRPLPEVSRFVAAADLLTLPSWNEGTPNVVLEALAAGRPVVATNVGGIPDLITGPELGELCPPRDPVALAAALRRTLDTPRDPQRIAQQGTVSWDESAERLLEVLRSASAEALP